jgi:type I restriction enzyme S subunit
MTFDLPEGWRLLTVSELAGLSGVVADGDWIESKDQDPDGDVRLIQLADIGVGEFLNRSSRFLTSKKARELQCTMLQTGDLLIARMPDPLGRACLFPGVGQPSVTAVDVFIWRPGKKAADARWLMHVINSPHVREHLQSIAGGTTRQRVSGGNLKRLALPTPPEAMQRRLAAKVDGLSARSKTARGELDHIPTLVDRYKQAVLAAAFRGDLTIDWRADNHVDVHPILKNAGIDTIRLPPIDPLPNEWAWVAAGSLCKIKGGITLGKRRDPGTALIDLPYLRVANVQRGWLNLNEIKTVSVTKKEAEALYLAPGDVLMNEGGDRDKLGRGWVWDGQIPHCIHQNHVFRLRPQMANLPSRYISYYANEFGQRYFLEQGKQTTNLASISLSKVSALPVPVAPPDEMTLIVQRIEQFFRRVDSLSIDANRATDLLNRLDQAILARAFCGKLVAQEQGLPR